MRVNNIKQRENSTTFKSGVSTSYEIFEPNWLSKRAQVIVRKAARELKTNQEGYNVRIYGETDYKTKEKELWVAAQKSEKSLLRKIAMFLRYGEYPSVGLRVGNLSLAGIKQTVQEAKTIAEDITQAIKG